MDHYFIEPSRKIKVIRDVDLCVIGGSCTGVFAAIRAAKLGLRVLLIERNGMLGGAATTGLVNIWHTLYDTTDREQIIAGLTAEAVTRLKMRGALEENKSRSSTYNFNPSELAILLDKMLLENGIELMLHTLFADTVHEDGRLDAVIIENNDGRNAIKAKFFIDATGDGFVARSLGIPSFANTYIQPPTACFHLQGEMNGVNLSELIREHGSEFGLPDDWGWSNQVGGLEGITMRADQHIFGYRCDRADDLTKAELEGRRQTDAFLSLLKKYGRQDTHYAITSLCSSLGLRETVHYATRFQATEVPLLTGARYETRIMNGTYPIDIHHASGGGISFRYLDGTETTVYGKGTRVEKGCWRERLGLSGEPARYYQIPFEILVGEAYRNFIAVGRMLNADANAYGALRVMVNLNQLGEAAGTAAALCLQQEVSLQTLDGKNVTKALIEGGSAL